MGWFEIVKASDFAFTRTRRDAMRNLYENPFHRDIDADAINSLSAKERQKFLQANEEYPFPLSEEYDEERTNLGSFMPKEGKDDVIDEDIALVNLHGHGKAYRNYLDEVKQSKGLEQLKYLRESRKDIEDEIREGLESGKIKRGDEKFETLRQEWREVPQNAEIDWADEESIRGIVETLVHETGHQATGSEIERAIEEMDYLTPEEKNAFRGYADEFAAYTMQYPDDKDYRDMRVQDHTAAIPWQKILEEREDGAST